ncbi:hypothetical protein FO440_06805 [Mucilaginibacter corticis]|uniref:Uncharacterized protein n=1 Tax=Mucilaginibacter corticis TaxID=2597670 RepID=A0A556MVR7_9SPHI|nr:hypothetical protein [Mucilaginibacter corticis]TSJ43889.1 hypothetical protein FO440_06805 [Mucilaginibacter corticis]
MENLQLMKTICMYGAPLCSALAIIFGFGWNYYGEAIKKVESTHSTPKTDTGKSKIVVKGDYIQGDKTVNHHTKPKKTKIKMSENNDKYGQSGIVNHGNLSVGQSGGTVNQYNYSTNELPPRTLNQADKDYLKSIIAPDYKVGVTIITSNSQETQNYGMQLLGYLQSNFTVIDSSLIGMSSDNKQPGRKRFYIDIDHSQKLINVLVQTQE